MNQKGNVGFGNGLMIGIVIGALFVLLFTTKKGRRILRVLSDDGFDRFKQFEGLFEGLQLDNDVEEQNDYLSAMQRERMSKESPFHRVKPTSRYHFRGVPRHKSH